MDGRKRIRAVFQDSARFVSLAIVLNLYYLLIGWTYITLLRLLRTVFIW